MGRPTGSLNKNKDFLLTRLQAMYGKDFHPIMRMAENADRLQKVLDEVPNEDAAVLFVGLKTSIDAWDKVASYTEPKLKAVEVTGEIDTSITIVRKTYEANKND